MAFIVEDGSIIANANAYITVAELKAYWDSRADTITQVDAEVQAAIIIATQYVDLNYNWRGEIVSDTQNLDWPRANVIDDQGRSLASDAIPTALKNAICEYAKRQLASSIQPDVSTEVGGITKIREKVDVIEQEIEYEEGSTGYYGIKKYPLADRWLKGLTIGGVGGSFGQLRRC